MHKLRITYNYEENEKTCEISELNKCTMLSEKPNPIEYMMEDREKERLLKMYNKMLQKAKTEEKKEKIQLLIDGINDPRIISGIDSQYGENPDKYFELEFENGEKQILGVEGKVELIEIPEQQVNIVSTWE